MSTGKRSPTFPVYPLPTPAFSLVPYALKVPLLTLARVAQGMFVGCVFFLLLLHNFQFFYLHFCNDSKAEGLESAIKLN